MNPLSVALKEGRLTFDRGLLAPFVRSFASHLKVNYEVAHEKMTKILASGCVSPYNGCKCCDGGWIRFETDWMGYTYERIAACSCAKGQRWLSWSKDGRRYKPYTQFHSLETACAGIGVRLTREHPPLDDDAGHREGDPTTFSTVFDDLDDLIPEVKP